MKFNTENIHENSINQGTSKFDTPLVSYLRIGYFKSEPRSTLYWLQLIRSISNRIESYGLHWNELLPKSLSNTLLAEYINDPRKTIKRGRFTDDEINELRQPQRIMLFFFLKKMAAFQLQNQQMILQTNNAISRSIFHLKPLPAIPDSGYVVLYNTSENPVEILIGDVLEAIIEGEPVTRKYEVTTALIGETIHLNQFITGNLLSIENSKSLLLSKQTLPLDNQIAPFRHADKTYLDHQFTPSLLISSPILYLSQGYRSIHLVLKGDSLLKLDKALFNFQITTANGWINMHNDANISQVTPVEVENGYLFIFHINKECVPIVPFNIINKTNVLINDNSCIKVSYTGEAALHFKVSEITLQTSVDGLIPSAIRNQDQVLDASSNYMPFGIDALLQSVFSFADIELSNSYLEKISANLVWASKPKNLTQYYKAYHKKEENFKVAIRTVYKTKDALSYNYVTNDKAAKLFSEPINFYCKIPKNADLDTVKSWKTDEFDPLKHNVYYEMELNFQDFGERQYPLLMSNYAIEYAAYENSFFKPLKPKPVEVNMPYTPEMSALEINYSSKILTWKENAKNNELIVVKNAPLGYSKYLGEAINLGDDAFGLLYFGFKRLTNNSTGNLYFNGPTGNARAEAASINWWYLNIDGHWSSLNDNILNDGTYGLTQTGLFNFSIPQDISNKSTLMPNGAYWLKVTIHPLIKKKNDCPRVYTSFQNSIMKFDGVFTNAMGIIRKKSELEISDNVTYLSAGTELFFEQPTPEYIVKLPFNTEGESLKETQLNFWERTFNGVRNKGRMVTIQDFENLILYRFRNLILVKCMSRKKRSNLIVVIVVNKQFYGNFPYAIPPLNSKSELEAIKNEMQPLATPFFKSILDFKIVNPVYRNIGFNINVIFSKNTQTTNDENKQQLYNDLQYYINPWFFEKYKIPQFGYWFDYGGIAAFLQEQPYIEAILAIYINPSVNKNNCTDNQDEILIFNENYSSITISNLHDYGQSGIDEMVVGEDFYVSDSPAKNKFEL